MNIWLQDVVVNGGLMAAAAVGLALHLRLVRFFDLSWALWAMVSAMISVYVSQKSFSVALSLVCGTLAAAVLAVLEDGVVLRRFLTSSVPKDILERFSFTAALAIYLVSISSTDLLGFRDQRIAPAESANIHGTSYPAAATVLATWGALLILAVIRHTLLGIKLRAMLDSPQLCALYDLNVSWLALCAGALAGALTGLAGSCFGLLYLAHYSTGLSLMLLAVIPCLLAGLSTSARIVSVAIVTIAFIAAVRFLVGYTAAEYATYAAILLALLSRPAGLGQSMREV